MNGIKLDIVENKRRQVTSQNVHHLYHIIAPYIADANRGNVLSDLSAAFMQSGLELTSHEMRERYEAVMKLCADGAKYDEILKAGNPKD